MFIVIAFLLFHFSHQLTVQNNNLALSLDAALGSITKLTSLLTGQTFTPSDHFQALWTVVLVNDTASETIASTSPALQSNARHLMPQHVIFTYLLPHNTTIAVRLDYSGEFLEFESGIFIVFCFLLTLLADFSSNSYALWQFSWSFALGGQPATRHAALFLPQAFGVLQKFAFGWPSQPSYEGQYPSTTATMQWFMLLLARESLYFGAHDALGSPKNFSFRSAAPVLCDLGLGACRGHWTMDVPASVSQHWRQPFPLVLRAVASASFFDGAQLYRAFVTRRALWMTSGTIQSPRWLTNTSLIINTGWSLYDVLAVHQGDPSVVLADVRQMRQLFPTASLLLHWYVWNNVR